MFSRSGSCLGLARGYHDHKKERKILPKNYLELGGGCKIVKRRIVTRILQKKKKRRRMVTRIVKSDNFEIKVPVSIAVF